MKKLSLIILLLVLGLALVACTAPTQTEEPPKDETAPVINGVKTIYHEIGADVPNFLQGVSAFDETDGNVTDSLVVDARNVNLGKEGLYTITYFAYDKSGNRGSKEASVNVSAPDVVDLTQPNYPAKEGLIKADMGSYTSIGDDEAELITLPPLITIEYNEAASTDLTWQTYHVLQLATNNYLRKTHLGFNVVGGGVSIYIKLMTSDGKLLMEREVASTMIWREVVIEIPETQRHLLNKPLELFIYAPRPTATPQSGSVSVSGIWFEGDKEPSIKLEYDEVDFETVYTLDISDLSNQFDSFDDEGKAGNGLMTISYQAETGVTIQNNGFNDWANVAFRVPDKDSEGDPLVLNEVEFVVIKLSITSGAIVKAKADWNSPDLFEFDGTKDGTMQYWMLPVGPNGYPAWAAVSIAASYLQQGTSSATIVIEKIILVKSIGQ
ncbi:immunoglobulin-like domain-containing protein [Acholeplasma hippikon]|nr:immunoglobulin-like domain-containing protein [Acholeplasma hippikon]